MVPRRTDRNGSVHTLSYDVLGRVTFDSVTTLGSGVDGGVRRIETAYDGQGNAYLITSYDAATGGSIVNQVERVFNGLGQVTAEYQEHGGAVSTSTSPKVQYAYSEMPSGADHSRLTSITYPDGYVLTYNYSSGLNDGISRLSSLSDTTGALESYDYLGVGTVVRRAHPQPDVDLSYAKRAGESNGDAGDQYTGLDRFGRVVDQRWLNPTSGTATDRFQYAYDLVGNRTSRDNLVNSAFGELYSYDDLSQLVSFQRGTLNGTRDGITGSASRSQGWDLDAVGNFDSVTTDGTAQTRTANRQNEITAISGATTPTYDSNGNMIRDEAGRQFVYDAWNRLVAVKDSSGTTLKSYGYDGLNRRVSETASGTTTELYYSSDWQVLAEKVGSNYSKRYVWSPVYVDAMVLRDRDTDANGTLDERLWVQQDANWNVTALVNGRGSVVERYVYDPYGSVTVYDASYGTRSSSSYLMTYFWQGRPLDTTSGMYNFRNREISPTLGRPIQVDMLRFGAGDVNFYRWERNGPINGIDPSGLAEPGKIPPGWYVDPRTDLYYRKGTSPTSGGRTGFKYKDIPGVAPSLDLLPYKSTPELLRDYLGLKPVGEPQRVQCPNDTCGFTISVSKFSVTNVTITKITNGNVPFPESLMIKAITNDRVKQEIEKELAGKASYSRSNCKPGCTPDASKAQRYTGKLRITLDKVPVYVPDRDWYVLVSGTIELNAESATITPCTKK